MVDHSRRSASAIASRTAPTEGCGDSPRRASTAPGGTHATVNASEQASVVALPADGSEWRIGPPLVGRRDSPACDGPWVPKGWSRARIRTHSARVLPYADESDTPWARRGRDEGTSARV